MNSVAFRESEESDDGDTCIAVERKILRDKSNPLEIPTEKFVNNLQDVNE